MQFTVRFPIVFQGMIFVFVRNWCLIQKNCNDSLELIHSVAALLRLSDITLEL